MAKTLICSCGSIENHTWYQTKMVKSYYLFSDQNRSKTIDTLWGGTYLYSLYRVVTPPPPAPSGLNITKNKQTRNQDPYNNSAWKEISLAPRSFILDKGKFEIPNMNRTHDLSQYFAERIWTSEQTGKSSILFQKVCCRCLSSQLQHF